MREHIRIFGLLCVLIHCFAMAYAVEGVKRLDSASIPQGGSYMFEDLNFRSFEMRWKLSDMKAVKTGENEVFKLTFYDGAGAKLYCLDLSMMNDGSSYGFNDDKFENLNVSVGVERCSCGNPAMDDAVLAGVSPVKYSTLKVAIADGRLSVFAGEKEYKFSYQSPLLDTAQPAGMVKALELEAVRPIDVSFLYISESGRDISDLQTGMDLQWVRERMENVAPQSLEGVYRYLDSDLNDRRVAKGGDYTIYLHPVGKDEYEIIYLSGAKSNSSMWEPGMVKGRLLPTIFENHYNVVWFDCSGASDFEELWADFTAGPILTVRFPLEKSQLRFYRLPNP